MYQIKYTEQNNEKSSEYETKALLFLLSSRSDGNEMEYVFIDVFNDLTGSTNDIDLLWDVQSKGVESLRPSLLGKSLVTLFCNYLSEIDFSKFFLIIPKLKIGYLYDSDSSIFTIENIINKDKVIEGLYNEYSRRITDVDRVSTNNSISKFLERVEFVKLEDGKYKYVQNLITFKNMSLKPNILFEEIFNEIRTKQTGLKNIKVEGLIINAPQDALKLNKHITRKEISILLVNRIIGMDVFSTKTIPKNYIEEIMHLSQETRAEQLFHCNANISRALFNKNNANNFWEFLEHLIEIINGNLSSSAREVYKLIDTNKLKSVIYLDETSTIYLISLIKEGLS